jgi:hypothetical protein
MVLASSLDKNMYYFTEVFVVFRSASRKWSEFSVKLGHVSIVFVPIAVQNYHSVI